MTNLVVAVTLGQRDLQVLAVRDGQVFSCSPEGKRVRVFHQWLLDRPGGYDIVAPDELNTQIIEQHRFVMQGDVVSFPAGSRLDLAKNADIGRSQADDGKVLVYPKLLSEALLALKRELSAAQVSLRRLIVLYTHRDEHSKWAAGEFIATDVFCQWLQDWLSVGPEVVLPVPFLQGEEELTQSDQAGNQHLLPEAARRIEQAIKQSASLVVPSGEAMIRLHDSGGVPHALPVLQASARLHFENRVQYKAPVERVDAAAAAAGPGVIFPAVAVLEARRRACDLVQRGEFQAAAELAREFPMAGAAWGWNQCLASVARYFQGYLEDVREQAATLDNGPTRQALQAILHPTQPMSLHVALRAEAALIAEDVLNATSLTVTFLDVAKYDAISRTLCNHPNQPCMDRATGEIALAEFQPTRRQLRNAARNVGNAAQWIRGPDERDIDQWLRRSTLLARVPWQKYAIFGLIGSLANEDELSRALSELLGALYCPTNTGNIPAHFRNITMHSVMTDREIQLMAQLFESDSRLLWRRRTGEARSCLHPETRPAAVLAALDVPDARELYGNLVKGLVSDLRSCPLV